MIETRIFESPQSVARGFAEFFESLVTQLPAGKQFSVALSGGSTPKLLFQLWAEEYAGKVDWSRIHFFWGDERCVSPEDEQSNFGVAKRLFLDPCGIPETNVHRVIGESNPLVEAVRYGVEIRETLLPDTGFPRFDLIILGMGTDGHTASIFPHEMQLMTTDSICAVATHPESGQKRITLTGRMLDAGQCVVALVTGESKADILGSVIRKDERSKSFPIAGLNPESGMIYFIDQSAAERLG
ncbi:MAG: 6-phosphogluconolactonase [Planctomycetota bacterium]